MLRSFIARSSLVLACLVCALAGAASGESALRLQFPNEVGLLDGGTYDDDGERVGTAHLQIETRDDGDLEIEIETGIQAGAHTIAKATLRRAGDGSLRMVTQQTRSFDAEGHSLGTLRVDHENRLGTCLPPDGSDAPVVSVELPERDRVANVGLMLLFTPLATGSQKSIDFQLFMCRGGPRVLDFEGYLAPTVDAGGSERVIEIRYRPDLGALSWIGSAFLPTFSVWLDGDGDYVAHRIPLYSEGPEVLVVRDGLSPKTFSPPAVH